jgi:WD40 repeat protein
VLGGILTVLLAGTVAVPLVVLRGGGQSDAPGTADRASASARLATEAAAQRAQDPRLAARLSLAAYTVSPTDAARDAMIASFAQSTALRVAGPGTAYSDLALSPDGTVLAGTDDGGRLHLWRLDGQNAPAVAAEGTNDDHASGVVFDSSGRTLASGGSTDAGRLWDVTDPARPHPLGVLGAQATPVHRLALGAHLLVTAGLDWSVGLWDVTDPTRPVSLQLLIGRSGPVTGVALRPDGAILAIAGVGGAVQLWNVRDPRHPSQVGSVPGHTGAVNTVAFSPDGRLLATGGDDRILQASDVTDPAHPRVVHRLPGHAAPVVSVAFTTASQLVSADSTGTVAYWNLAAATPVFTSLGRLDAPARAVSATVAGPVALATDRGTVLLGTLDPARLRQLACATPAAAPSRDEWRRLVPDIPFADACAG